MIAATQIHPYLRRHVAEAKAESLGLKRDPDRFCEIWEEVLTDASATKAKAYVAHEFAEALSKGPNGAFERLQEHEAELKEKGKNWHKAVASSSSAK